jgi:hypothetical protein
MSSIQQIICENLISCALLLVLATLTLLDAKKDQDGERVRFYGWVEKNPKRSLSAIPGLPPYSR